MAATKRSKSKSSNTKLFVLDTNVLMHDPTSLFRFDEHDIYLPMMTLEELDNNKKGMSEVARNARQTSRFLDELVNAAGDRIDEGIPLAMRNEFDATGHLFFQTQAITAELPLRLPVGKADNLILGVVLHLQQIYPKREVILVSKDINMRIKARAMGFAAEDYFNDKVLEDTDLLYTGLCQLSDGFWDQNSKGMESWQENGRSYYRLTGPDGADVVNTFHDKPATLSIGSGELSPALEGRLLGLVEGSRTVIELPAGEAFGPHNPEMVQRVALSLMRELGDPDETWRVGDVVRFPTPDGKSSFAGVVRELGGEGQEWILFDFNHPLAGQPVTFEVQLIGVL